MQANLSKPGTTEAISHSAFKVMLGGGISLVAGLISQLVIAALFGAGANMDAFLTALVIPDYIGYVLITGFSFVLVPAFVHEETVGSDEDGWKLVGTFFWGITILLFIVSIAGSIFSRQIISLTAPGFGVEKSELATKMLVIMMYTVPCIGLASLTRGIQNARSSFFWPAFGVGVGSFSNAVTLLILYPLLGPIALAWGNLVSAITQALVTVVPVVYKSWGKWMPLKDPRVPRLASLITPFIVFGLMTRSVMILERLLASGLPDGDLSYIGYAGKISSILVIVLANGIASATFPAMARDYSKNGEKGLVNQTHYGLRLTLATALPAICISGVAAIPLITVIYERQAFIHATTINVARVLFIVLVGDILFRMLNNIISRSFYVLKDTFTFPLVSAIMAGLYIFLGKYLVNRWGYVGLAAAQPVQMGLAMIVVFGFLLRRLPGFNMRKMSWDTLLYGMATAIASLAAWLTIKALSFLPAIIQLPFAFVVAFIVYFLILYWRDREMALALLDMTGLKQLIHITENVLHIRFHLRGLASEPERERL